MKVIKKSEYKNDGIFINLETSYPVVENLIRNHYKYLNKNNKYYIWCAKGVKSRRITAILEAYGYDVTQVIN